MTGRRIIVGICGGIAAYKSVHLVRLLKKAGAQVQVLLTPDAQRFVTPLTLGTLSEREVLVDIFPENENGSWTKHVHLGLWADLMVVAPATANTVGKLVAGACDSMLTAVALSARCPVLVAPAMDHDMYIHPATQANLATLISRGVEVMDAEEGLLASGLTGLGRLPEPEAIAARIDSILIGRRRTPGPKVLVTAGPTREALDPVRFLSNRSTGTMGFALAESAARLGADVTLVAGPVSLATPDGVRRIDVSSAETMRSAVMAHQGLADVIIMSAAVADFAPVSISEHKIKKGSDDLVLRMRRTPDILKELGASRRDDQTIIGFALETQDGEANARRKLEEKNLDWIVLNNPNEEGAGFGTTTNRVTLLGRSGAVEPLPLMSKADVALAILSLAVPALRPD